MMTVLQKRSIACHLILFAALVMPYFARANSATNANIIWLDTQVTSYAAKTFREAHPNCYPGDMVQYGRTLAADDVVIVGQVRSAVPKYYSTWYGQCTVEVVEVLYGTCEADSVKCLSTNTFVPLGKDGCSMATTVDGPGWLIPGDVVLLALRRERANPSIRGMYFVAEVRYFQTVPVSRDQVTFVQYSEPAFDWDGYALAIANGTVADPYGYLTVQRARSESFADDVAALLGGED